MGENSTASAAPNKKDESFSIEKQASGLRRQASGLSIGRQGRPGTKSNG
jgi:hypothetical protein